MPGRKDAKKTMLADNPRSPAFCAPEQLPDSIEAEVATWVQDYSDITERTETPPVDETRWKKLCEAHMREAQLIQSSLLPEKPLRDESVEIAFRFINAAGVSGDFADFFPLPEGRIGLYMGDVVGKGLSAAMYGALVMGTLRGIHKAGRDTGGVLAMLNERLMQRPLPGRFCCTLYGVFNPEDGELLFSNAGLPLPLLISKNKCQSLGEGGFPSGMFPGASYDEHRVRLAPGDGILFATDGLHEARNQDDIEFCNRNMVESWAQCAQKSAEGSLNFLLECLRGFSNGMQPQDDVTMLVLKIPA